MSASASTSASASGSRAPVANGGAEKGAGNGPPAKRGRRSNPKVKTGCSNCKQRRIKCDEKRPACTQCVRSGRSCTGYPPPSRIDGPISEIRIAPKPVMTLLQVQPTPAASTGIIRSPVVLPPRRPNRRRRVAPEARINDLSPTIYQPSGNLRLDGTECLYFDLFRVQTASELSGYFNSTFWAQRVLQECHFEGAIRHAVIALGALYKTLELSSYRGAANQVARTSEMDSVMLHWQVAVKQYSEAINAMVLLDGENMPHHRTRLMASILLACFDSFIGDHKQAIRQIQNGLLLLEQVRNHHPLYPSRSSDGYIEQDLVVMFTRLAIQAKSYDMAFHFPQPYVIRLAPQGQSTAPSPSSDTTSTASSPSDSSAPIQFESILDARLASDRLCEKLLRFIERLQIAKNNPSNVLPASWKQYGLSFKDQLDAWSEAFEPIFRSRLDPGIDPLEKSGISALKMFQINTNILFMMMFCDTEVQFDAFQRHFEDIVKLGWEVVSADERRAAAKRYPSYTTTQHPSNTYSGNSPLSHIRPSFSADVGIVPPLFVVATKCREPNIRRQAIQLLRSSARREGMWDSELAANIGQWIMQVEEYDDQAPWGTIPSSPIPEERRIMVKSVDFDLRERFAVMRVGTRALYGGMPDNRFRETRLTW
ncbi:hypothetical protein HIM_06473 [Hirsutella minnesotensis 3608]|uniref:Zn(2)-C6 fungal-type domain-containing protein n=1 Tax=Hirsutella minnesotensis 3608 TaxID=1043627 RepID=A0A0F7ZZH7_9HYPO|nr:hypothetical protein HIM_06473 [Hirsutella minnesotensis 3608]